MEKKEILFHVGLPKTGTTTVQTFLMESSPRLAEKKISFPYDAGLFGSHVPAENRPRVPPHADALCYFYSGFNPATPSTLDWGGVVEDFLTTSDCQCLIISHESQYIAANRLKVDVFSNMWARADLRFLAYLREPVSWLTSLHGQTAYEPGLVSNQDRFPILSMYIASGYLKWLKPFEVYGTLDLHDYDALRKSDSLLPDFLESINAGTLTALVAEHRSVNVKKSNRDTVLLLTALKTVRQDYQADWWPLIDKIRWSAQKLDQSPRAFFPADLVRRIQDKWGEDREILARDYGLDIADTPFPDTGPDYLSIDPVFAAELKASVFPKLTSDQRGWTQQALDVAIVGSPNPYLTNADGKFKPVRPSSKSAAEMAAEAAAISARYDAVSDVQKKSKDEHVLNMIARSFWTTSYRFAHPDVTKEEIQSAWLEAAPEYKKITRISLKKLEKNSIKITG